MKSKNDSKLCHYKRMHNALIEIGRHVDETQLQSLIRELIAMSNMYPHRDSRSEEVNTRIYLLVLEIEELAENENSTQCWDPFKDFVVVDLKNHYLPKIRGANSNGKVGFIDTNIVPELDDISNEQVKYILSVWMRAYCEERGWEFSIGDNVEIVDAITLALMFEGIPHINPKCRLLITTELECIQLCIINGTIHMTLDGTDMKNKIPISEYLIPELLVSGTHKQIEVLRHQFAFYCTTSYLGTEGEQAAGVIPAIWKAPYQKDHANGDNTLQTSQNVCSLLSCRRQQPGPQFEGKL